MKLRPKFEAIRSSLMNCAPSPSLDVCFGELLHEKQRLATQTALQQNNIPNNAIAYAAHGRGKVKNMQPVQCYSCKEYGHMLLTMQRNLATIARSLGTLSKTALLVLKIAKLMLTKLLLVIKLLLVQQLLTNQHYS